MTDAPNLWRCPYCPQVLGVNSYTAHVRRCRAKRKAARTY